MTILFSKTIQRPSFNPVNLGHLKRREVELLQMRALEIKELNLQPATPRVAELLAEECLLAERVPSGIQGWSCLGPTQTPQVVLVGQNPYMMSYVQTAESIIGGMSSADQRALWLTTSIVLKLQGRAQITRHEWMRDFFKTGKWRKLMTNVSIVNAQSYRYFVVRDGKLDLATSLKCRERTLGAVETIRELDSLSEEIFLTTLSQSSVKCLVVAQGQFAADLERNRHLATAGADLKFFGCFHWNHPDVWGDFQAIIDQIA